LKKIKGFLLIEYLIYLIILSIIVLLTLFKIKNTNERIKEKEAIIKIVNIVDKYCTKSFKREEYKFIFQTEIKSILIYQVGNERIIEKIRLPKILDYKIPYDGRYVKKFIFNSTINSNTSKAFSIYIFNKKKSKYRVSFYLFRKNKILKINIYKSLFPENMNSKWILYNYDDEKIMKERWAKINDY